MRMKCLITISALLATLLLGCDREDEHTGRDADGKLIVAVSIPPQAWLLEQIGGDHVRVITLISPGDSPHTYQPTQKQITDVHRSAVYFRIGVNFENGPWFRQLAETDKLRIVDLRQGIWLRLMASHHRDQDHGHADHHGHTGQDPHVWLSTNNIEKMALTICNALGTADPSRDTEYVIGMGNLIKQAKAVREEIEAKLAPHRGRAFIVYHPAWGYFADEFGLRQIAVEVEGKTPTQAELTELTRLAKEQGARAVFVQPQISGESARVLARSIGGPDAEPIVIDPLAPDVLANLRKVADRLAVEFERSAQP
jgi:zinc transport system substrate-binding protein